MIALVILNSVVLFTLQYIRYWWNETKFFVCHDNIWQTLLYDVTFIQDLHQNKYHKIVQQEFSTHLMEWSDICRHGQEQLPLITCRDMQCTLIQPQQRWYMSVFIFNVSLRIPHICRKFGNVCWRYVQLERTCCRWARVHSGNVGVNKGVLHSMTSNSEYLSSYHLQPCLCTSDHTINVLRHTQHRRNDVSTHLPITWGWNYK